MIFLRYESFRSYLRMYPGTSVLIALNIVSYIATVIYGDKAYNYGAFVAHSTFDPFGLLEPWRYITSIFMHGGLRHLLFNMFALLVFAPPLEGLLRTVRYVPFYLLCGIAGNIFSALMHSLSDSGLHVAVGASGAIYGVYGAYLFIALYRKAMLDISSRKTVYIILGFGVIYSLFPGIDLWGHVGGALAGFLLYSLFDRTRQWKKRNR